jgi:2-hydroxychromene-2-carboxylate isomerase
MTSRPVVDFYYGIASRYSYLASTQIPALERDTGCGVAWHPLHSAELMRLRGRDPFDGGSVSGQYDWPYRRYDAECWAGCYGLPYREPDFDNYDPRMLARACVAARRLDAGVAFSNVIFP